MLLLDSEVISPEVKSQAGASAQGSHQRVKFLTWVHCLPELNRCSASEEDGKNRYLSGN